VSADDAEREEPEATEPEAVDDAAEAAAEADAEAAAVPEDVPENAEEQSSTEPAAEEEPAAEAEAPAEEAPAEAEDAPAETDDAPAAEETAAEAPPERGRKEKKADVVPGADLEPIAISEERELPAEERAALEAEEEERAAREARATADDDDQEVAPRQVTVPADAQIQATGKRKSAVARVIVRSGDGNFQINDRSIEEYFPSTHHQALARQPLVTSGYDGNVDVRVRVHGGGVSGQAGAVRHGVARAHTELEPELRGDQKRPGQHTRDDRRKERKKAGLKKARKRPQFSKR
jgi:small subunit ribosomal protein S9